MLSVLSKTHNVTVRIIGNIVLIGIGLMIGFLSYVVVYDKILDKKEK